MGGGGSGGPGLGGGGGLGVGGEGLGGLGDGGGGGLGLGGGGGLGLGGGGLGLGGGGPGLGGSGLGGLGLGGGLGEIEQSAPLYPLVQVQVYEIARTGGGGKSEGASGRAGELNTGTGLDGVAMVDGGG